MAVLKLELNSETKITLLPAYAPTADVPEQDLVRFYVELDEVYNKEEYFLIIMGDFNVKIGANATVKPRIGDCAVSISNKNGEQTTDFAVHHMIENFEVKSSRL